MPTDTPPEVTINLLIERAMEAKASDIHLTPGRPPILRVYGDLRTLDDLPMLLPENTLALAQQMTDPNQWERFLQTRELDCSLSRHRMTRFRVNLCWQRGSVAIAMRAIPHEIPSFDQLGLPAVLKNFAAKDRGLFLVTGPTGSGKSTTLATMIDHINSSRSCHIVTIEDPIEYLHRHKKSIVNQREMHYDTLSFHEALRHVLRQDPNVILIGELRDLETIEIAMTLAETGHLVLATLHTGDTSQAITRIIDVYPPHQQSQARTQLSLVLVGIMAQQLIRRRDGTGRVMACEIMSQTPAISHMIRSGEVPQMYSAIQTGASDGMITLNASLLNLYRANMISREDALHKSTRQKELMEQLNPYSR